MLYKLDMGYRLTSLNNRTYVNEEYSNLFSRISTPNSLIEWLGDIV